MNAFSRYIKSQHTQILYKIPEMKQMQSVSRKIKRDNNGLFKLCIHAPSIF